MQSAICQIIDSSGSLPREVIVQRGICEVPFYYRFSNPDYFRENVDSSTDSFYQHLKEAPDDLPHTSAPNIYDWVNVLEDKYEQGARDFVITTISSKLSASYQTASSAKQMFEDKHSDVRLAVVNSNTCACGQAAFELAISAMIGAERSFESIVSAIDTMKSRTASLFAVHNLKYMRAGGRIGGATAFIGGLINVKPVCEFVDGVVRPLKAVPGRRNSLRVMTDIALSRMPDISKYIISIQNAMYPEDADYIEARLRQHGQSTEIHRSDLGIIVGAHSGPGAIGIGFVPNPLL